MGLRDIFSRKKSVSLFYSAQEAQARWKKQIREKIRIPAGVQAFTSGDMAVPMDGATDAAVRYDARRIPGTNRWDIEKTTRFPKGSDNAALAGLAEQILGQSMDSPRIVCTNPGNNEFCFYRKRR